MENVNQILSKVKKQILTKTVDVPSRLGTSYKEKIFALIHENILP